MRDRFGTVKSLAMLAFVCLTLITSLSIAPAKAQDPTDGRINRVPWVNGHGAVAVYCVDANGGNGSFTGGGIKVLTGDGQQVIFAPEAQIKAAMQAADQLNKPVLILSGGLYSLYALPKGWFQINSTPDGEGKVLLGMWYGCIPVGPGPNPVAPTPPPTIDPCIVISKDRRVNICD